MARKPRPVIVIAAMKDGSMIAAYHFDEPAHGRNPNSHHAAPQARRNRKVDCQLQAAIEKCKQLVGRPNFRACMQSGGSQRGCKSQTVPKVKACVRATLGF
jgi:hypothetical protein